MITVYYLEKDKALGFTATAPSNKISYLDANNFFKRDYESAEYYSAVLKLLVSDIPEVFEERSIFILSGKNIFEIKHYYLGGEDEEN